MPVAHYLMHLVPVLSRKMPASLLCCTMQIYCRCTSLGKLLMADFRLAWSLCLILSGSCRQAVHYFQLRKSEHGGEILLFIYFVLVDWRDYKSVCTCKKVHSHTALDVIVQHGGKGYIVIKQLSARPFVSTAVSMIKHDVKLELIGQKKPDLQQLTSRVCQKWQTS